MRRSGSRHLVLDDHGLLNRDMSRTPSMMLIDINQMSQDCDDHMEALEALEAREEEISKERERERLNSMQRRMPSGSLLEAMKEITDFADKSNVVMLQGFNWESWRSGSGDWYGVVASKVDLLEEMGITDIWLPPPSQSVAPQGYLPSRLFDLDGSQYGSQASLESLIKTLHQAGIRAVADIVVNHRCGDKQDNQGRWNQFSSGMTSRPSFAGVMDWGGWAITLGDQFSDGTGQNEPGAYDGRFDAAPDIDHRNKNVQEGISVWLRWLRLQVGFDAWRFDFVKGYSAEFVGLYCKKSHPAWAVGELWCDMEYDDQGLKHPQDKHRQDTVNWINGTDKTCTAFDFTTKGILQEAVRNCQYWRLKDSNGKPPGLIGWMPKHAVTFIDNHDTGSTQRHWPFPDDKVLVGYAYIISHPGLPSIFWDHVMDWGEDHRRRISEMLQARRESGIPVDAVVKIQCADRDLYLAEASLRSNGTEEA
jgi:alpha-amylase